MINKLESAKIADPYSEALFKLALGLHVTQNNPDIFYKLIFDIQDFLELFYETPELQKFLRNPLNSTTLKKNILNKILKNKISSYTLNFLNLLIDKKRIDNIEKISQKFLEKTYDFVCIKFVEIKSTIKLTQKQQETLILRVNKILGPVFTIPYVQYSNIQLTLIIDKTILGGLIIKIGSKTIDLSLQNELQRLGRGINRFI
jgi:F-type H+-transporting ATPase subunit delta